jgi:MFS family permease
MTVVMKIDLVGPRRRGLALGLNEAAGYLGVAATAFITGALAATYAPLTVLWVGAALIVLAGLSISIFAVRDTGAQVALEQQAHGSRPSAHATLRVAFAQASLREPILRACSQAGLVNNLNDALAWGLAPLYLAAHGASVREIAVVAAAYPVVWGAGQLATGWLSDHIAKAADHGRDDRPGGRTRPARRRRRRLRLLARRRAAARRRHGDGLPDPDRRRLGRQPAARPDRRRAHRRQRPARCSHLLAATPCPPSRRSPLKERNGHDGR